MVDSAMVDSASKKSRVRRLFIVTIPLIVAGLVYAFVEKHRQQKILADFETRGFLLDAEKTFGSEPVLPRWVASAVPIPFGWETPRYPGVFIDNFFHRQCEPGETFSNDDLRNAASLTNVRHILLSDTPITDAGLVPLRRLTGLESLVLQNMRITDAGAANFRGLTNLEILWLANTEITDAGLVNLAGMKKLERLYLGRSTNPGLLPAALAKARRSNAVPAMDITDSGLVHLKGLGQLRWLSLASMPITDAGLPHLAGLTKLEILILTGTKVTPAGVAKLQRSLPATKIVGP